MKENRIAAKLDDIFADGRLNVPALAMVTKRIFSRHSSQNLDHWYMMHKMMTNPEITADDILDYTEPEWLEDIPSLEEMDR